MACPTCDHTMHQWGEAGQVFVCPRCGTVKDSEGTQVPQLVTRVIEFAGHLTDEHHDHGLIVTVMRLAASTTKQR